MHLFSYFNLYQHVFLPQKDFLAKKPLDSDEHTLRSFHMHYQTRLASIQAPVTWMSLQIPGCHHPIDQSDTMCTSQTMHTGRAAWFTYTRGRYYYPFTDSKGQ